MQLVLRMLQRYLPRPEPAAIRTKTVDFRDCTRSDFVDRFGATFAVGTTLFPATCSDQNLLEKAKDEFFKIHASGWHPRLWNNETLSRRALENVIIASASVATEVVKTVNVNYFGGLRLESLSYNGTCTPHGFIDFAASVSLASDYPDTLDRGTVCHACEAKKPEEGDEPIWQTLCGAATAFIHNMQYKPHRPLSKIYAVSHYGGTKFVLYAFNGKCGERFPHTFHLRWPDVYTFAKLPRAEYDAFWEHGGLNKLMSCLLGIWLDSFVEFHNKYHVPHIGSPDSSVA